MMFSRNWIYDFEGESYSVRLPERCSSNIDGQMPEPRIVGRVADTDSHALFFILFSADEVSPEASKVL